MRDVLLARVAASKPKWTADEARTELEWRLRKHVLRLVSNYELLISRAEFAAARWVDESNDPPISRQESP